MTTNELYQTSRQQIIEERYGEILGMKNVNEILERTNFI